MNPEKAVSVRLIVFPFGLIAQIREIIRASAVDQL
jgi:hypothetical protein